jgi:hypothetical protein
MRIISKVSHKTGFSEQNDSGRYSILRVNGRRHNSAIAAGVRPSHLVGFIL